MREGESLLSLNQEDLDDPSSRFDKKLSEDNEHCGKSTNGAIADVIRSDVIVIGTGFSGITAIDRFRKRGWSVKCFESGADVGGVWYWNRDSESPFYQLNIPEVYRNWDFSQRFSDHVELRRYFAHIKKTLKLEDDIYFNARVNDCRWSDDLQSWTIKTQQGHTAKAKYLIACTGTLHRAYTPDFPGIECYTGELYHSGAWPEGFKASGKKIAVIGAGATAVQITQELGKQAEKLTVLLRRPSYCLPMGQRQCTKEEQETWKSYYPALFKIGRDSATGLPCSRQPVGVLDVSSEERETLWEELWHRGGFAFSLANYNNILVDKEANKVAFDFWRRKVCSRLTDPEKQKIMAPEVQPYYYGTKRAPLEQDYYEVLNQPNVHIHDLNKAPLTRFSERGIVTSDGKLHDFDVVVLATGFDSYTGSLTQMGLHSKSSQPLSSLWSASTSAESGASGGRVSSYLGLTIPGFPNFFMSYSPQSPAALSNAPTTIEIQIESIADLLAKLEGEGMGSIEATEEAAEGWSGVIDGMSGRTLIPFTDSWWNAANIPGKKGQNLIYMGGVNNYEKQIRATMDGWKGFNVVAAK